MCQRMHLGHHEDAMHTTDLDRQGLKALAYFVFILQIVSSLYKLYRYPPVRENSLKQFMCKRDLMAPYDSVG